MSTTRKSATTELSKQDKDARKCFVRNFANDQFSLVQGPRSQYYGVIGIERWKDKNIYPWITIAVYGVHWRRFSLVEGLHWGAEWNSSLASWRLY
jgi:hypothetical protein